MEVSALVSAQVSQDSVYSPAHLSNFGNSGLPYVLIFLTDPRRALDFLACSAIYLLSGQSGNFQTL